MYDIDYFKLFIKEALTNCKDGDLKQVLMIYRNLFLNFKKENFHDYCIEKYGEYKAICIIEILKILSIDYVLINDSFANTQEINTDKVNNLREALETLNLLVG
ncbi:MAG: hypothetical protein IJX51_01690 [Clostridia bacterium]|nr:hypothetical protein [Clostridia bacterium]